MEESGGPETPAPGPGGTPTKDPLEEQHSGGDSFLAAARLLRRGWSGSGRRTQWQISPPVHPASKEEATPIKTPVRDPGLRVLVVDFSGAAQGKDTRSETKVEERKEAPGGATGRPVPSARPGVTYVWASGCRNKYRHGRRLKAPILPVILEM